MARGPDAWLGSASRTRPPSSGRLRRRHAGTSPRARRVSRPAPAAGQVDFDEQILGAIELLLTDPAARLTAQRACRLLLVDEFQDLTPAHLLLVRLLAAPAYEVFGVGDDDQTIYGYNGADPTWLIEYARFFPGAADHPLEVNYRCPDDVVTAADDAAAPQPPARPEDDPAARAGAAGPAVVVRRAAGAATVDRGRASCSTAAPSRTTSRCSAV